MVRHIDSLVLVWYIAEREARELGSRSIEPPHLFIGLLKIVDVNLEEALANSSKFDAATVESELEILDRSFGEYDLDTKLARRRLRRHLKKGARIDSEIRLRRSPKSKAAFLRAEGLAEKAGGEVNPVHLLIALLQEQDPDIESILEQFDCFPTEFRRYLEGQAHRLNKR